MPNVDRDGAKELVGVFDDGIYVCATATPGPLQLEPRGCAATFPYRDMDDGPVGRARTRCRSRSTLGSDTQDRDVGSRWSLRAHTPDDASPTTAAGASGIRRLAAIGDSFDTRVAAVHRLQEGLESRAAAAALALPNPNALPMQLSVRTTRRAGFAEVFATVTATDAGAAREAYDAVASALRECDAEPISEKVYGDEAAAGAILAARGAALRAHGCDDPWPCTFVDGRPAGGGTFAGVQVWGVAGGARAAVRTVPGGRLWHGPGFRALHLSGVHGRPGDAPALQAEHMFGAAAAAARQNGFEYTHVVRTWIYFARLLDWYGEFNRVRGACYRAYDFGLPASTGIQGRNGDHECLMDALLVDGIRTRPIDASRRQGPAHAYGSAFSRGVELVHDGGSTVHVSGTASIGRDGRSLHLGDASAQFLEMMLDIAAVLAEAGMELRDIQQATLFCKDAATLAACREARDLLALPPFPTVAVLADVCRPELLVEMEAIASR